MGIRSAITGDQASVPLPARNALTRADSVPTIASHALILVLLVANVIRTFRHAMWRDELQAFQLAANSPSLWDVFASLKYEGHPGLWHTLLWLITRITIDPMSMQALHAALAIGTWLIIYRWSPFGRAEKLLLLLSYYLFWEYFVISRNYVLVALLGFAFLALRQHRPGRALGAWLLLGLLANTAVFGAIWSIVLAAMLVLQERRWRSALLGGVVYLACLAFAVITMMPAADFAPWAADVRFDPSRFNAALAMPLGAFVPLHPDWITAAWAFQAHLGEAPIPSFWNPNPITYFTALTQADLDHPLRLAAALLGPVAVCWLIVRDRMRVLEFTLVYAGVLLFANIWNFPGAARHHGILFLALIACAWTARATRPADVWSSGSFAIILAVGAIGGLLTLASELRPFSQGRNAADWIGRNNLADAYLIGSRDAQVSTVAGYLGRPIYYLECGCRGRSIVWNSQRRTPLPAAEFGHRLTAAVASAEGREALLILHHPITAEETAAITPILALAAAASFTGAVTDESFWIYRVRKAQP